MRGQIRGQSVGGKVKGGNEMKLPFPSHLLNISCIRPLDGISVSVSHKPGMVAVP